jgi:hypothetical protein
VHAVKALVEIRSQTLDDLVGRASLRRFFVPAAIDPSDMVHDVHHLALRATQDDYASLQRVSRFGRVHEASANSTPIGDAPQATQRSKMPSAVLHQPYSRRAALTET